MTIRNIRNCYHAKIFQTEISEGSGHSKPRRIVVRKPNPKNLRLILKRKDSSFAKSDPFSFPYQRKRKNKIYTHKTNITLAQTLYTSDPELFLQKDFMIAIPLHQKENNNNKNNNSSKKKKKKKRKEIYRAKVS